jgi:hypothetical protein
MPPSIEHIEEHVAEIKERNGQLCAQPGCGRPYSEHANFGEWCPAAWPEPMGQRKFKAAE